MSKIKFRAFIKKLKWIVPVEMIDFSSETVEVDLAYGNGDTSEYGFDEIEIMQFTGLKDKNGRGIYEGDIFPNHFSSKILGVVRLGEYISMGDDNHGGHVGFFIDWGSDDMLRKDLAYWVKISHVIGNVHEGETHG